MNLPSPIQAYFEADQHHDVEAFIGAFAPDAVVIDEGRTYTGRQAIDAWWRRAKAQFEYVVEPIEIDEKGGVTEVRGKVTGQFPGSPATLTFAFRLEHDQISWLEITP